MSGQYTKPRIPAASVPILIEIDRYINHHDVRGSHLTDAASDVCDGLFTRPEVEPLVRRRLLSIVRYEDDEWEEWEELCGRSFTVELTERAIRSLWPDRAIAKANKDQHHG